MDDLIAFLAARLDEDEAAAKANIGAGPGWSHGLGDTEGFGPSWPDYQTFDGADLDAATGYLDRFRPLRMLREVTAGRAILTGYVKMEADGVQDGAWIAFRFAVEALASAWSDHPDYRPEWKT